MCQQWYIERRSAEPVKFLFLLEIGLFEVVMFLRLKRNKILSVHYSIHNKMLIDLKVRKISILTLKYTLMGQNKLFFVIAILDLFCFQIKG